jgi:hypothetical protein
MREGACRERERVERGSVSREGACRERETRGGLAIKAVID